MSIQFEVNIPDEPFKNTFELGKKVRCTYNGSRYVVISTFADTNVVSTHEGFGETLEEIDMSSYVQEGMKYHIIDATKHPLMMAFITHSYTNEEVDAYTEELHTGEIYEYPYEDAILNNIYNGNMPTYNSDTDTFSELMLLEPAISQEEFDSLILKTQKEITEKVATNPDATDEWKEYRIYMENFADTYAGIDHWKIPFKPEPVE